MCVFEWFYAGTIVCHVLEVSPKFGLVSCRVGTYMLKWTDRRNQFLVYEGRVLCLHLLSLCLIKWTGEHCLP